MNRESASRRIEIRDSRFEIKAYWSRQRYLSLLLGMALLALVGTLTLAWGSLRMSPDTVASKLLGRLPGGISVHDGPDAW